LNNDKFRRYTINTINLLKELVRKAKAERDSSKEGYNDFMKGLIMGYYSIFTLLKQEAFAFCIDQKELGLKDLKPEVDLLDLDRNSAVDDGEDNWRVEIMSEEKIKGYLIDSITLLKEQAIEARKEADNPKESVNEYSKGELMAYYLVFSLLKNQSLVFDVDEKEIGLADINPECDLV
jgi:hypothetical protein